MAKAGDEIVNARTGQRMVFLETGEETSGQLLRIDTYSPPSGVPEPYHVNPFQESGWEMLSGSLRFRVAGEERLLRAGESITVPAGIPHTFWNDSEEEAHYLQWLRPALKMDRFFETFFGLAQDGKLNEKGLPPLFQMAVMVPYFGDEIRLTSPPWPVQKFIFGILALIGRLLGYQPEYPYSHDGTKEPPRGEEERSSATGGAKTRGIVVAVLATLIALLVLLRRRRGQR